ncbi:hypothetical protein V3C99_012190 [Haemonchus contortus]|uniref:ABC transporter permease n=1 Tax=Haemonchus contortus TaxID=6289 RepID=A0A7I4Y603_HAECO
MEYVLNSIVLKNLILNNTFLRALATMLNSAFTIGLYR